MVPFRGPTLVVAILLLCVAGPAAAERIADATPTSSATAYGIKILLPNAEPIVSGLVDSPTSFRATPVPFAYPADGSVVQIGLVDGRSAIRARAAQARSEVHTVSLFGGEVTVDAVTASSGVSARGSGAGFEPTSVTGLVVLGQPVEPTPNLRVPLGDWGHLTLLQERTVSAEPTLRGWVTVLDVRLDADHAGLPIGTRILVGYAEAAARALPSAPVTAQATKPASGVVEQPVATTPEPATVHPRPRIARGLGYPLNVRRPGTIGPSPLALIAPVSAKLTAKGYVFPVYGQSGFGDSFGAPRADTVWHHGDDIFAPLGAPLLAVADGMVFSVGQNRLGGNRLWLRDLAGNEFYYAHLSAFSPLAVDGARVHAGDVLGFVGNTGDAAGTPYHLHFEVHPASLLFLGEDGVVNPTPYLRAWQHLLDVDFPSAAVWAPTLVATGSAPAAGAILLQASDISSASGLEPGALTRALGPAAKGWDGALGSKARLKRG
jgi:murein DD-endopeptidase MepM/ murein hydrolase activator NlpD